MMIQMMNSHDLLVKKKLKYIQNKISTAYYKSNRKGQKITLVAVSKGRNIEEINRAVSFGLSHFGENRVQEFIKKKSEIKNTRDLTYHFIGRLQSNKIKKAIKNFDFIHTIDSLLKIKKVNKIAQKLDKKVKVFLQINIGNDPNKQGFKKKNFLEILKQISNYKNIIIVGIMTITPQTQDKQEIRKYYKETKALQIKTQKIIETCQNLSMGMTNDYEIAIEEGATHIRIGRGIFDV